MTGDALLAFINEELFPAMKGLKPTGQPGDRGAALCAMCLRTPTTT
jgi:hypothetical protein